MHQPCRRRLPNREHFPSPGVKRGAPVHASGPELVKTKTRPFAKRQMTWFRRPLQVEWISVDSDDVTTPADRRLLDMLRRHESNQHQAPD